MWPSRLEAVLSAFAWEAAERERDMSDIKEALEAVFPGEDV